MNKEKGQIQIVIIGLVVIGALFVLNFTGLLGGKKSPTDQSEQEQSQEQTEVQLSGPDIGPEKSNLLPSGTLPSSTRETIISVNISEPGYCRYSTKPNISYNSMSRSFTYDQAKTSHSAKIGGLDPGQTYEYYIKCRDLDSNKNTSDSLIRFSVGSSSNSSTYSGSSQPSSGSSGDEIPPRIFNLFPAGSLPSGTVESEINVSTDEPGYCRYSTEPDISYNSMSRSFTYDKAKLNHTAKIVGLEDNKTYEYYVKCRDIKSNKNTSDVIVRFGVGGSGYSSGTGTSGQDITPPYRYNAFPDDDVSYYTKSTTISLKTDENASCRYYSNVSGIAYGQMRAFSDTGSVSHATEVTGLSEDQEYNFYIKCQDEQNNVNTDDFLIVFTVESFEDKIPPVRSEIYPTNDLYPGTTETLISLRTNEDATCRYDTEQGTPYKSMRKKFTAGAANIHTAKVTGLEDGNIYSYFVRCQDKDGNANTGDVLIKVEVLKIYQ